MLKTKIRLRVVLLSLARFEQTQLERTRTPLRRLDPHRGKIKISNEKRYIDFRDGDHLITGFNTLRLFTAAALSRNSSNTIR